MFQTFVLLSLACLALASPRADSLERQEFELFKAKYNKVYANAEEEEMRFNVFRQSLAKIEKQARMGTSEKWGINHFADLTGKQHFDTHLLNVFTFIFSVFRGRIPQPELGLQAILQEQCPTGSKQGY